MLLTLKQPGGYFRTAALASTLCLQDVKDGSAQVTFKNGTSWFFD